MKEAVENIRKLLTLLVKEDFKYFNRVKNPDKALLLYLGQIKPFVSGREKKFIEKVEGYLKEFDILSQEQKKRLMKELHTVFTLKFSTEEIERNLKERKERVVSNIRKSFFSLDKYPVKAFFQPVSTVKSLKPQNVKRLKKLGLETIYDVLFYLPYRYEDRTTVTPLNLLKDGETALVKGKVVNVLESKTKKGKKLLKAVIYDTHGKLTLLFLQPRIFGFYKKLFFQAKELDKEIIAYGRVRRSGLSFTMVHPEIEIYEPGRKFNKVGVILPVYHLSEGLKQNTVRRDIAAVVKNAVPRFPEYLPQDILKKRQLPDIAESIWNVHFPSGDVDALGEFKTPFQKRLIYDELFLFQLILAFLRKKMKKEKGIAFPVDEGMIEEFKKHLPFKLTSAQEKVLFEIVADMRKDEPMNRLVQGDVGSGKTVVAAASAFFAVKSGYQVAVMAPTEILANQHFKKFKEFLFPFGIKVGILTGSMTQKEKNTMLKAIQSGYFDVVVGTHALIQDKVEFKNLGLVIIDEQHRFGVKQRAELKNKGRQPDFLVMTATPIPRTLALTAYGDLDISIIDELPAGRKPVKTKIVFDDEIDKVVSFLKKELEKEHRVYVVYPLVEESEKMELKAATEMYHFWREKLKGFQVGLLHGKMKQEEKDKVMEKFKEGEYQVLVSTTVIEVGVDVPEATVMVIEHAERFGLAQLHQLRGRVGRSDRPSYCFLVTKRTVGEDAIKRLKILESTNDGFKVAEADLAFRGPGELTGTRQSGVGEFKIADLRRDFEILKKAREDAFELIEKNPELSGLENLKELLNYKIPDGIDLVGVG
ncbi:ATP-dependent DNA helicase RecG [Desulfurobacterium atlanticum]|uniref:ATP-dependent DNA helicase RecG n=1 Tax=Desulfurobacterium atlanticum TaxID=240169 RepID=A0A238YG89_9BACT|nr:ATP-dependent DNA helicase RecG [Desulfurobacterium atlanticum]SNR69818.1 ATP-dependent DNA helicase RecG [Desulfurobacterium atlanticum]